MSPRPLRAALTASITASIAAVSCLGAVPAHAASDPTPADWVAMAKTYTATAKYAYEPFAKDGGFLPMGGCVASSAGGTGYTYVNMANVGSLDPAKPAALVYADEAADADEAAGATSAALGVDDDMGTSGRKLVAVEWIVKDTGQTAPALLGRTFEKDQMPGYYTLRAWLYQDNPQGLTQTANPDVACVAS